MSCEPPQSADSVVNEPLRLLLSPQEQAFIVARIAKARRQVVGGLLLPGAYFGGLYAWASFADPLGESQRAVALAFVLGFFIAFGFTFHLLLAGTVDWIMFTRYRRNHKAFLNRYNRT